MLTKKVEAALTAIESSGRNGGSYLIGRETYEGHTTGIPNGLKVVY